MSAQRRPQRRGAVAPLGAALIVVLLGMVAFAVDVGWIVVSESELQNAADAAALAGVQPLMNGYVQYSLPGQSATNQATILSTSLASARANVRAYAGYNTAGGVTGLTVNDADIEFGLLDANNKYTPLPTYTGFPNAIKVTLRRDGQANGALRLYFAPVLGCGNATLQATATATAYGGTIDSFSSASFSGVAGILPMTYDVNHWNQFLSTGMSPDGTVSRDSAGNPSLQIYPSNKFAGNFGFLSLDNSHVGASTLANWISNGMSSADYQALVNAKLIPLSGHNPNAWDWQGDTGFKASDVSLVNSYTGKTYLLPLFKPVDSSQANYQAGTGNGSHYYYNIVQFVAVKIVSNANDNRNVYVEPAATVVSNALLPPGSITPAGTSSQLVTTFTPPKLSR